MYTLYIVYKRVVLRRSGDKKINLFVVKHTTGSQSDTTGTAVLKTWHAILIETIFVAVFM